MWHSDSHQLYINIYIYIIYIEPNCTSVDGIVSKSIHAIYNQFALKCCGNVVLKIDWKIAIFLNHVCVIHQILYLCHLLIILCSGLIQPTTRFNMGSIYAEIWHQKSKQRYSHGIWKWTKSDCMYHNCYSNNFRIVTFLKIIYRNFDWWRYLID